MTGEYIEDPEVTPQSRWRWAAPAVVLVVLPLLGVMTLRETDGSAFWPSHNGILRGIAAPEPGAVGTSGASAAARAGFDSPLVIREVETITGQNDGHPLVGRHVDLHVPVAAKANDQAFWVGTLDNRVLVVPQRDTRDSRQRQVGLTSGNAIAFLEAGKMAAISGEIQKLPNAEQMFSWGLTAEDRAEAEARGVYLHADRVSVQ